MCALELVKEADIVLAEHAQVLHHVFQVGDALYTQSEGITAIDLAVDAAGLKHGGIYHAATQDLDPAGVLAETAALATTQHAGDVHLGTGLGEGEVTGTQADLGLGAEQLLGKVQEHLLQVGKGHILVNVQAFNLVEEAVGAGCDRLVAIHAAGADDADGRLLAFHRAHLDRTGVAPEHDVAGHILIILLDEEGVLHVAGRMVGSKVQRAEHVPVVLDLGTIGDGEAQAGEDVDDLLAYNRDGVTCAQLCGESGTGDVDLVLLLGLLLGSLAQGIDLLSSEILEFVEPLTQFAFLLGSHVAELVEQCCYLTFLAQVLDTQCLQGLLVLGLEVCDLRLQRFYLIL